MVFLSAMEALHHVLRVFCLEVASFDRCNPSLKDVHRA